MTNNYKRHPAASLIFFKKTNWTCCPALNPYLRQKPAPSSKIRSKSMASEFLLIGAAILIMLRSNHKLKKK